MSADTIAVNDFLLIFHVRGGGDLFCRGFPLTHACLSNIVINTAFCSHHPFLRLYYERQNTHERKPPFISTCDQLRKSGDFNEDDSSIQCVANIMFWISGYLEHCRCCQCVCFYSHSTMHIMGNGFCCSYVSILQLTQH